MTGNSCATLELASWQSAHGRPDFLGVLSGKGHVILRRGTTFEIKTEHASSVVSLANQIEVDRRFTRALFFVLYFDNPHPSCLPLEFENDRPPPSHLHS